MIAYIEGKLAYKEPAYVIIDVNGVGYLIKISLNTYSSLGSEEKCKLFTFLHIKEDAHTLFGFSSVNEKKLFLELISVSGVGPSIGLMMLSSMTADEIQEAIVTENVKLIQSIKGIGAKTAQRLILELKDKMRKDGIINKSSNISLNSNNTVRNEALSALVTLGINKSLAEKSLDSILSKKASEKITLEDLIKQALKTS